MVNENGAAYWRYRFQYNVNKEIVTFVFAYAHGKEEATKQAIESIEENLKIKVDPEQLILVGRQSW